MKTKRETETYEFIKSYIIQHGHSPSGRIISKQFNIGLSSVYECINRLVKKGYLRKNMHRHGVSIV